MMMTMIMYAKEMMMMMMMMMIMYALPLLLHQPVCRVEASAELFLPPMDRPPDIGYKYKCEFKYKYKNKYEYRYKFKSNTNPQIKDTNTEKSRNAVLGVWLHAASSEF